MLLNKSVTEVTVKCFPRMSRKCIDTVGWVTGRKFGL